MANDTPADVVVMPDTIPAGSPIDMAVRQRCIVLAALKDKISVTNAITYEYALGEQAKIREQMAAIEDAYEPVIRPRREVLDGFYADKRALLAPLQEADKIIGVHALTWKAAADAADAKEKKRLQDEADAQAERERQAQLDAIEKERKRAVKSGDKDAAKELAREAEVVAAAPAVGRQVQITSSVPTVDGMAAGAKWKVRDDTIDIKALCEAVYKGWCSPSAVEANVKFLNGVAKLEKARFNDVDPKTKRTMYPGVAAYNAGQTRRT